MATTNIQSFAGDVEVSGELTVTGQLNSVTGSDKVKLTATTSNETDYIPVAKSKTGAQALYTDSNLTYNPANNVIAANLSGNVSGNVSGNAAYATNAAYANSAGSATNASYANSATHANNANTVAFTDRDTSNNTDYIAFVDTHTAGDKALFVDQNLTYNSSTNQIGANLSGNVTGNVSGNAAYANNAGLLGGAAKNTGANANSIAQRDGNGDLFMRYGQAQYFNMSHGAGARNGDTVFYSSTDNYIRKNTKAGFRTALDVPTRTGTNASGTWSINVNGNAAYANSAGSATNASYANSATHANNANSVAFTDRDSSNNTDYIAFVDGHGAGDKALFVDQNLTYNSSTNHINANVPYATSAGYANSAGSATNASYANNASNLGGRGLSEGANASSIAARDGAGDIQCRLVRPNYTNQNTISGAMAYRVNNGNDNYVRFCSNTGSIRGYLNVPTRTGGDASGTWSINVNGNAAYANNAGNVHIGSRDGTNSNTHYPIFSTSHVDGQNALYTDSNMYYNPANSYLNVNASYAGSAGYATSAGMAANATFANNATTANRTTRAGTIVNSASRLIHGRNYYNYNGSQIINELSTGFTPFTTHSRKIVRWRIEYCGVHDQVFRVMKNFGAGWSWQTIGLSTASNSSWSGVAGVDICNGSQIYTKTIEWYEDDYYAGYREYGIQILDSYTGSWNRQFAINRTLNSAGQSTHEVGVSMCVITEVLL